MKERKGFTMAELLIVVAIIAVLVAIAIPIFTTQLEKSRDATDQANIRAAYAEIASALVSNTNTSAAIADLGLSTSDGWGGGPLASNSGSITYTFVGQGTDTTWSSGTYKIGGMTITAVANATTITFTVTNGEVTAIALS